MSAVAKLLSFVRSVVVETKNNDVKVDLGGGDLRTLDHFADSGDDSFPLLSDYVQLVPQKGTGRSSAVGYLDPKNLQKSLVGEKRIYARNSDGVQVAEVWLENTGKVTIQNDLASSVVDSDGSVSCTNSNGSFVLQPDGDFVVNGVTIKANGDVVMPNSLVLNGREIHDHGHPQANDSAGNTEANTGGNL